MRNMLIDPVAGVVDLKGHAQGTVLSITGTAAQTAAFSLDGIYDVWSTVDCWLKVDPTANDVTALTGYLLRANQTVAVMIRALDKLGAITGGGSGSLSFHKIG